MRRPPAPVSCDHVHVRTHNELTMFASALHDANTASTPVRHYCRSGPHCIPHAVFYTDAQRDDWLALRGLTLTEGKVVGTYRLARHLDAGRFRRLNGNSILYPDFGEYTRAIVTQDDDGLRTVHLLYPEYGREVFDYPASERREREGRTALDDTSPGNPSSTSIVPNLHGNATGLDGAHSGVSDAQKHEQAKDLAFQAFRRTLGLPPLSKH